MAIAQHRPVPTRQEQTTIHWQTESISPRSTTMSNRIYQPLIFSIDDRLSQQHLTKLDLCSKTLKKIEKLPNNISFNVVLLDYNDITKIEHLDILTHLIQLSISHNRLIDIRLLSRLRTLQKLNLSNNSLDSIDSLKTLQNLVMLNISSNNIQNLSALNTCHSLQSLDASDNSIRQIEDLSHLTSLKYLNLHKNLIDSLISIPKHCPKSIHTLIISDNEIKDLTEVCYLSSLIDLNTLYIHDNPCLFIIDDRHGCHQPFDYRPYVLNWSLAIQNLDGISITRKESLKAEWLLSQGKGRSFRPGEHNELVQYLIRICGTDADERDDLHLSRIMFQQDLYKQNDDDDVFIRTSDTKDSQSKLHQSLLISESEFVKISPTSSINEEQQTRTPSPGHIRSTNDDHSSTNRYSQYDNRPIKPLDKNVFQSKLNQYPIDTNISQSKASTNPQQSRRTSTNLAYNANRYSPKSTPRGPIKSAVMRPKPDKNPATQPRNQAKRHTIAADNVNTYHMTSALKMKHKQRTTSNRITDNDDELQLKSAPVHAMLSTQTATKSVDLKKLTTSVATMRTSVLQAYLDLHERFTKTTELQTSALSALWKMFETQNLTHQHKSEQILEENRLLKQRLRDLESRLNIQPRTLHPPLRAHISKRDTKSFFLHWIPNPLNEQRTILGYRIYIDDIVRSSIDSGKFEAIIDYIRDEGEYKIKLRAYDENGESDDSNIVVARFRRQYSETPRSDSTPFEINTIQRTQSDHMVDNISQIKLRQTQSHDNLMISPTDKVKPSIIERMTINQSMSSGGFSLLTQQQQIEIPITPDKNKKTSEELISPITSSPSHSSDNIISRKPLKSPGSSPNPNNKTTESYTKVLFANDSSSSTTTTKRSPTRTGIMSRFAKSPHRIKRNNVLLNALPINLTPSPTEVINTTKPEAKLVDRTLTFQPELNSSSNHIHILAQQFPIKSIDILNSSTIPPSSQILPRSKSSLD